MPAIAVGAPIRMKAGSAVLGTARNGLLGFRMAGIAVLGFAGLVAQGGLTFVREACPPAFLAREQIVHAAQLRLERFHLPCFCRWFSASHVLIIVRRRIIAAMT